ncbi:MAG: uroporphyrinogen-III synthase [Betaproteobacteria bacterium]|nr:uroporphyrinogen-III synthase [Betaproteobacteria bacterium]
MTRPRAHAEALARLIREAGGEPLVFPAIEIRDLPDLGPILAKIDRLEEFDLAIFISPNAVHKALNLVQARRAGKPWPSRLRVAAVGRGSRRELEQQGFAEVIAPAAHADSEALLALPELSAVAGKRIVIFRGDGGRELLGDTLAARGAHVEYAECYRRARPAADSAPLLTAWARGAVHAVTVSSGEGLANLFDMLGKLGQQWLRATPLFVPHPRVAESAVRLGVREVLVAGASDAELVARLVAYFRGAK